MSELTNWLLVFVRVGAMMAVFPFFSSQNIPVQVRLALGGMTSFLLAPMLPPFQVEGLALWGLIKLLFAEISVGLLLGYVARMVFFAIEFAGAIIATEMGLMLSSNFNPLSSSSVTAPGMLLYWLAMMLLLTMDMHHWMLLGFHRSYDLVPPGTAGLSQALLGDIIGRTGSAFMIALQMTAPLMAVSFIITLVFSMLGRAVPQMNVFAESFSVRTLAGLAVFGLTSTLMAQHIANYLHRLPEDLARVALLMGGG